MYLAQAGDGEQPPQGTEMGAIRESKRICCCQQACSIDNTWRGSHPSAVRLSLEMHSDTESAQVPEDRVPVRHKACGGASQAGSQCVTGPAQVPTSQGSVCHRACTGATQTEPQC